MPFDFGALPPEIVSAWMYSGAGSGPLMSAASSWGSLAAELEASATSAQLVLSELVGEDWTGPASAAMTSAVSPYLSWLTTTSAAAHQASSQAMASAGAFEAARAAVVSPAIIAANRAQLATLVASNFLGVNTPAILATEAHYMQMWAQDTLAMFGYSTSSSSAAQLSPMPPAPQATTPAGSGPATGGSAAGGLQQGLADALTSLQGALQTLASPLASGNALDLFLGTPLFSNAINGGVNTAAWFVCNAIPTAVSLGHTLALAGPASLASDVAGVDGLAAGLGTGVLAGMTQPVGAVAAAGTPVLAGMGQASTIGGMSVPAGWSAAAGTQVAASTGSGWTVAAEETAGMHAVPAGMGPVGAGGRGGLGSGGGPRYGFRPTVMPKQVLV